MLLPTGHKWCSVDSEGEVALHHTRGGSIAELASAAFCMHLQCSPHLCTACADGMTQSGLIVPTELCAASAVAAYYEVHSQWGSHMQILKEDDASWPPPDKAGRQELEIILGEAHISFTTTKLGSLMQVQQSKDPDGLRIFYYLVQVRSLVATGFTFACVSLKHPPFCAIGVYRITFISAYDTALCLHCSCYSSIHDFAYVLQLYFQRL